MIQRAQINGIEMAYRIDGPDNGPVVVMSNSLMSSLEMWDDTIVGLTDKYRVVRYDTRGHGRTEVTSPGPYSIPMLGADLIALMDHLKIARAHLVGLSMGGMICQFVGANFPDRVLSLSLCNTASEMPPRSLWEDRIAAAKAQGIASLKDGTIKRWFVDGFPAANPQKIEKIEAMILGTPLDGYVACAGAIRDMAQTTMLLKIKAPTQIIAGEKDPATTVDNAIVLNRMIEGSELSIIKNAAHLSNIEKPAEFNQFLRTFLDKVAK